MIGVCREQSVGKLDAFKDRITIVPGPTDDRDVIRKAVEGCDGVLTVLMPRGVHGYSTGTAEAVLAAAEPGARLVFSCGWHITRDGKDRYPWRMKALLAVFGPVAKLLRFADIGDQIRACNRIFASDTRWTVVRGSDLEEGESEGLPVWSRHAAIPSSRATRPAASTSPSSLVDALTNDELVQEAPAIVSCKSESALAHAGEAEHVRAEGRTVFSRPLDSPPRGGARCRICAARRRSSQAEAAASGRAMALAFADEGRTPSSPTSTWKARMRS